MPMDYTTLDFEDVLRLVTERLDLDTTLTRKRKTDSVFTRWSSQLMDVTKAGRHAELLQWLDQSRESAQPSGKELIEQFNLRLEAVCTTICIDGLPSSAWRDTASTQSQSGRMPALASSGSSTSNSARSCSSSDKMPSAKTTPNTSFETEPGADIPRGPYRHASPLHLAIDTIAGAEMAQARPVSTAGHKRKREHPDTHDLDRWTISSANMPLPTSASPQNKQHGKQHSTPTFDRAVIDDLINTDHRLRSLPTSNFGAFAEQYKTNSIENAFEADIQQLRNSTPSRTACPLVLRADIKIDVRSGKPLFKTDFDVKAMKLSTQLERRFGWKRFMYATLPLESKMDVVKSNQQLYHAQVAQWLMQPKSAFGCSWQAFLIKESKAERKSFLTRDQITSNSKADKQMEVVFFATEGPGLEHITLDKFIHCTLHVDNSKNRRQTCLKLYSRFEILLSRTVQGITFEPAQFRFADDPTPSTEHDSAELNALADTSMTYRYQIRKHDKDESMTDGNAMISVGAALLMCKTLGLTHRPTAFQGRVLGAKGVWYISAPYSSQDSDHTSVWIQLHKSQRKIFMDPDSADATELTFNVTNVSFKPKSADLHRDFLPILQDRGVPFNTIAALHSETTRNIVDTWTRAIQRPTELTSLLHSRLGSAGPRHTGGVFKPWALTPAETALHFVQSGFLPSDNQYVSDLVLRTYTSALADDLTKFRIKCPKSTVMMGITDPYGILGAHEVFFCFSKPFKDDEGEETGCFLSEGDEVLLARDPALRPSDMQKFVYSSEPRLAHLQDVVVFSTKGRMPSAAKLQGGDYDGDAFSVIWEPRLTGSFRNVPAPEPKEHHRLEVGKISTTLEELATKAGDKAMADSFLEAAFEFRMKGNLLGLVTNYTNALAYSDGLWASTVIELADLHGYLIDSSKNGYTFSEDDWRMFQHKRRLRPSLSQAWKKGQEELKDLLQWQPAKDDRNIVQKVRGFLLQAAALEKCSLPSILDRLWFGVMLVEAAHAIGKLTDTLTNVQAKSVDGDLTAPQLALGLQEKELRELSEAIRRPLKNVLERYKQLSCIDLNDKPDRLEDLRLEFLGIPPPESFRGGRRRAMPWLYSEWEIILTVLLLRRQQYDAGKRCVLFLATGPICFIKAHSETGRRRINEIEAVKRPRPHLINRIAVGIEEEGADAEELSIPSSMLDVSV